MSKSATTNPASSLAAGTQAASSPALQTAATGLPVDEFHGVGGAYEIVDGVRRRVAAAEPATTPNAPDSL